MYDLKNKILYILENLMKTRSLSYSKAENEASEFIYDYLSKIKYFQDNKEYLIRYKIENDVYNREIICAVVKGNSDNTLILSGHFDVVGIEEFGDFKDNAFDINKIEDNLKTLDLSENNKKDLYSKEWIYGRGSCDMKGGLSASMAILEEYSKQENKDGNLIFLAVPEEETYSIGMRESAKLLSNLKNKYNLNYKLMIIPEPNDRESNKHTLHIGTVGKCMPTIMVQGVKAHIMSYYNGLNPLSILSGIFEETEGSLKLVDSYKNEKTPPPLWSYFKDLKYEYDVSIPFRAAGYFTVLHFSRTPEEIINEVKKISVESFNKFLNKFIKDYKEYNNKELEEDYKAEVYTLSELIDKLKSRKDFESFYQNLKKEISIKIREEKETYPNTTIFAMEKILDYANFQYPFVLISFSPPYYPAVHSDFICGKEKYGSKYFKVIEEEYKKLYNIDIICNNYMTGISDASYSAVNTKYDYKIFSENMIVWGNEYSIDFNSIEDINIPTIIFGPWGKDLHRVTERVNKKSLLEEFPNIIESLMKDVFSNN
ncbi:M20/M25/M40 family metallo-hydrolase [Brachyspira alvinipulli]|uniref:M20/M25/M40 family metallo-hydrolase n=1 Tax=Brachyspira alvinipulli TaxID=84379 RepID=UPI000487D900|nr:M20/M25/M40 family metallo-hydrolase [Brachyspira alvinipulli]